MRCSTNRPIPQSHIKALDMSESTDVAAKIDMKIPAITLAAMMLAGAGMFYGLQARVTVLEIKSSTFDKHIDKQGAQVEAIRAEAESSRTRMQQSVSEIRELLIELRGNSRRLEEKLEARGRVESK